MPLQRLELTPKMPALHFARRVLIPTHALRDWMRAGWVLLVATSGYCNLAIDTVCLSERSDLVAISATSSERDAPARSRPTIRVSLLPAQPR